MSGRFFMLLREKYGLIYSSKIETGFYDETGDFTIFTQTDHAKLFKNNNTSTSNSAGLLHVLLSILNDLIKNGITEEELKTTKGYLKGDLMIDLENIDNETRYNGLEFLLRKKTAKEIVPLRDIYKTYYADLTLADIHQVICKYFIREGMSVCLLGERVPNIDLVEKEFTEFSGKR
jgi:predicted Zn-dependent peptidase